MRSGWSVSRVSRKNSTAARSSSATVKITVVDQARDALPNDKTAWEAISGGLDIINVGKFEMQSRAYLGRFNFKGPDQQKLVGNLSGGERGRLHLAQTLITGANVLLLDEPSNDLDVETLRALEDALLEFAGCVLVISHDRWFLDRIATHILAFEGDSQLVFFNGNYQEYEADMKKRLGEEGARPKRVRYKALKALEIVWGSNPRGVTIGSQRTIADHRHHNSSSSNPFLSAAQSGQVQSSGTSSQCVPGAMPSSGTPFISS